MTSKNSKTVAGQTSVPKGQKVSENQPGAPTERAAPKGKLGVLVELLSRPQGATIADMATATGWQDHSVRGALAGALKQRGFTVCSEKVDRLRTYRLEI